jgi:hypothetical protein
MVNDVISGYQLQTAGGGSTYIHGEALGAQSLGCWI